MFDLRSLEHSTIIYEPSEKQDSKNCMFTHFRQAQFPMAVVRWCESNTQPL
jgi:hypothetical protein